MDIKHHPFWDSDLGSQLILTILTPPESQLKSLNISFYLSCPVKYRVQIFMSDGSYTETYCGKNEALKIIKKDWLEYYKERTEIQFIQHSEINFREFFNGPDTSSSESSSPGLFKNKRRSLGNSFDYSTE